MKLIEKWGIGKQLRIMGIGPCAEGNFTDILDNFGLNFGIGKELLRGVKIEQAGRDKNEKIGVAKITINS